LTQRERLVLESRLVSMWREVSDKYHWSAAAAWTCFRARWEGRLILDGVRPETAFELRPGPLSSQGRRSLEQVSLVAIQAVTLGKRLSLLARRRSSLEERLYWHGLAAEAAEALAEWCSRKVSDVLGWKKYLRLSPGFPCWPRLYEQRKILGQLRPFPIGLRLRRNLQLEPEYSTTALLLRQDKMDEKTGTEG